MSGSASAVSVNSAGWTVPTNAGKGNLYVASCDGGHVQKFVPRPGADPGKLLGPQMLLN